MPYRLVVVLGALRAAGWRVTLAEEAHDGPPEGAWRQRLAAADLLVGWCGEMYPGTQIPGLLRFLELCDFPARPPLVVGGGFFPLVDVAATDLGARVDAVLMEPGEVVLPAVADALVGGGSAVDLGGVCSWSEAGFRANPPPRRTRLDPRWLEVLGELDFERYGRHVEPMIFDNLRPAVQVPAGAGCAKSCAFCFDERSPYGVFPAAAVVRAAAFFARERGVDQVLLGELDFLHRKERALEVVAGLTELRAEVAGLSWFALASVVDLLRWDAAELDRLAPSGCYRIELGAESGSDRHLRELGKRHRASDALVAARRLSERGVRTTFNLLLGAPGETAADRRRTLRLAHDLSAVSPRVRVQPRLYQVVPRTSLGVRALASLSSAPATLEEIRDYRAGLGVRGDALPWLSPGEVQWVQDLVQYVVPMACERPDARVRSRLRRVLRRVARLRCRHGWSMGVSLERRLFGDRPDVRLPSTLVS